MTNPNTLGNLLRDRKRPGGSNTGKYPTVKAFAGPAGGAPRGTFPINTRKRGRSALALAHNAPNPAGIRRAVKAKYPSL
jgi:hypothetical protein